MTKKNFFFFCHSFFCHMVSLRETIKRFALACAERVHAKQNLGAIDCLRRSNKVFVNVLCTTFLFLRRRYLLNTKLSIRKPCILTSPKAMLEGDVRSKSYGNRFLQMPVAFTLGAMLRKTYNKFI